MHPCHVFQRDALRIQIPSAQSAIGINYPKRLKIERVRSPSWIKSLLMNALFRLQDVRGTQERNYEKYGQASSDAAELPALSTMV